MGGAGVVSVAINRARKVKYLVQRVGVQPILRFRYRSIYNAFLSGLETQDKIATGILENKGFMVSRLGSNEAKCMGEYFFRNGRFSPQTFDKMSREAGFYPPAPDAFRRFGELSGNALSSSDVTGIWNTAYQHQLLTKFARSSLFCDLGSLEPFFEDCPWTHALEGKKVLVVNPFIFSISRNYAERKQLPLIDRLLPDFDLSVIKPPVTLAGNVSEKSSWFEELEKLENQVREADFDVAILGCGSYGMPLASSIKRLGKVAIHLGGSTQLLFGVKGSRWASRKDFAERFDGSWRAPDESERPENYKSVEGGCYW